MDAKLHKNNKKKKSVAIYDDLHFAIGIRHVVEKKLYFVTHVTPFNLKKH